MFEMAQTSGSEGLRPLNVIEASITLHKEQATRGFLGIGRDLIDAKAQIGQHGQWMPWLERMGFKQSTANKYMQVARAVSEGSALEGLSFTQIAALLALPAGEREAFALENGVADKSGAEIKKLIKEKEDALRERNVLADAYEKASLRAARAEKEAFELKQRMENTEPCTVKVVETPDDYQQLKMAAAHHQAEMEEAAQAAEEAEQRAAAAEAELARMRREQGGQSGNTFSRVQGAVNTFLIDVQLLPYDRQELGSAYNRQRYASLVKSVREWCDMMADALEGGPLDAEGAVV